MEGTVSGGHAVVSIPFRTTDTQNTAIEFVVDTGFAGFLTLPASAIAALGLPYSRAIPAHLADDSVIFVAVHLATVLWDKHEREVEVLSTGKQPLLGTARLDETELVIQFRDSGQVSINPL